MSIILEGLVDGNLLITEGLGQVVSGYVPSILEFYYSSDIVSGDPSTPFNTEQINTLIAEGLFIVKGLQASPPRIQSGSSIQTSKIYVDYIGDPIVLKSMGLETSKVWSAFFKDVGAVTITAIKPSIAFFSKFKKLSPQMIFTGDSFTPTIVSGKEDN